MIWSILVLVVGLGCAGYRLSLTVRAIRARRAGDEERSDQLHARGFWLSRGYLGLITAALVILVVVTIVTRHR